MNAKDAGLTCGEIEPGTCGTFDFLSSSRDEGLPERDGGDEFVEGEGELGDGEEVVLVLEQAVDHGLGHQLELEDGRIDASALAGADLAACKSYSK